MNMHKQVKVAIKVPKTLPLQSFIGSKYDSVSMLLLIDWIKGDRIELEHSILGHC